MYLRRRRMVTSAILLLKRLLRLSRHPNGSENGDVEKKDNIFSIGGACKDGGIDQNAFTGTTVTSPPAIVVSSTMTILC